MLSIRLYSSPAVIVPRMNNEPMLSFARDSPERVNLLKVCGVSIAPIVIIIN